MTDTCSTLAHTGHKGWRKDGKTFIRCYTVALKSGDEFNPNFVLLYFWSCSSIKMWHLHLKNEEKNNKAMHLRLVLTYLLYNLFNTKKYLALALKKIVHLLFCVLQTKLNKAFNIFCRLLEWIRNVQVIPGFSAKDLDENLAWLTEKTEDFQVTPVSSKTFCAPQVILSEGPTTPPL